MISTKESTRELLGLALRSEFSEVELVARNAEVLNDVGNDATRHVARMPRESDDAVGAEGIGVMPVAAGVAKVFTADFAETTLQMAAVERWVFAHRSGSEHELVAEGGRDGTARVQQSFQVSLGRLLKTENGLAPIMAVGMATGQEAGFGNPHAVLVASRLDFRDGNYHNAETITVSTGTVNAAAEWNVAQIFNLPYRRFAIGGPLPAVERPQVANLPYSRLQVCATSFAEAKV